MPKNKLKKFADMKGFRCVLEYPRQRLLAEGFPLTGQWNGGFFQKQLPLVLELGCGRGEYTVGLAKADPTRNYLGIDIKGARMWTGASEVERDGIPNAGFLRCEIENIPAFFAEGEVDEIWITFPDPQMQKPRKRLTSTRFLDLYRRILRPGGVINLKTDSPFLYEYTRRLILLNRLPLLASTPDLYAAAPAAFAVEASAVEGTGSSSAPSVEGTGSAVQDAAPAVQDAERLASARAIQTYYEQQWLSRGKTIKLLSFTLPDTGSLMEPDATDIPRDDYRAYPRHVPTC